MNRVLFVFFILVSSFALSQKITWGIAGGYSRSFEYANQNNANPFFIFNSQQTIYKIFRPTYGFYTAYQFSDKQSINIDIQKLTIIKQAKQDSLGNPILKNTLATIHNANFSICYGYDIKKNIKMGLGIYDNYIIIYGLNRLSHPIFATNLEYNRHTIGMLAKVSFKWQKISTEGGIMFPFNPSVKSISTVYYIPTSFVQAKIQLPSWNKFLRKMKKNL